MTSNPVSLLVLLVALVAFLLYLVKCANDRKPADYYTRRDYGKVKNTGYNLDWKF